MSDAKPEEEIRAELRLLEQDLARLREAHLARRG